MNVVFIIALACFVTPVFGRSIAADKAPNKPFKGCGSKLNDAYKLVCELPSSLSVNFTKHSRSKRGLVDECCLQSCSYAHITEYCPGKPNYRFMLENELREAAQEEKPVRTTIPPTNEVRKRGKNKARRDGRWRRQPIVMPCMYRSYAHFLLRERRRLQGKIRKQPGRTIPDGQHGTTGERACASCGPVLYKTQ